MLASYSAIRFSDRFLDVPPWWFWADWKPARRGAVEVPRETNLRWQSPQVAWRAWFPNDTDLLAPWLKKDYAAHWNLLAETMLRLKLNMVDVGSLNEKDVQKAEIPRDRGLALTTTHTSPFGASLRDWDRFWAAQGQSPPPARTLANVKALEAFWEAHIRLILREKLEMLWMIGFRGDGDKGFFKTFPDAPPDEAGRARVIENMMRRQVALLKRVTGDEHPPMRTVLYDECSDYVAAGLLHPPDEPSLIWNFVAARRDHFPAADVRQYRAPPGRLLGYYFNAQFTSTGSHLADGEGPWKMEQNHRLVRQSGPNLVFSVINSGNTREFPLTLAAHAQMMWDFNAYDSGRFVEDFCRRYWGSSGGPQVAQLYRDYYDAYWQQRRADLPGFARQYIFQDLRVARATRELLQATRTGSDSKPLLDDREMGYYRIVPSDNGAATKLEAVMAGCGQAAQRFGAVADQCTALAPRLSPRGRPFFDHSLRVQAAFMAAACRCAVDAAQALKAIQNREACRQWVQKAKADAAAMEAVLATPTQGSLANWYAEERIFGLKELQAMIDRRVKAVVSTSKTRKP